MESMDWVCNYCGGEGEVEYPTNRIEEATLIVCSHCLKPSAYLWCEYCGMGGQIAGNEFLHSPMRWRCMECGSEYDLPDEFYQAKITFTPEFFADAYKLRIDRDITLQKHIPIWAKNAFVVWEEKRIYLAYGMFGVCILFVITLGLRTLFNPDIFFFPLVVFGMLLPLLLFLCFLVVEAAIWLSLRFFLLIYKLRES
jgi:hypothetical protein